ncbi:MAG: acyl--CoA ligase, partial [Phaeodactylibacter sp.]|nr:acyl--CoA ligase [Phaeodactylibacter sp.]
MSATAGIFDVLQATTRRFPDKTAIVDRQGSVTYRQLETQVYQTARFFQEKGIAAGDRVLVLVPYSIDLYRTTLALNYLGAAAVFIEDWISFQQIEACCQAAQPTALVTHGKGLFYARLKKALRQIPLRLHHGRYAKYPVLLDHPKPDETAVAIISFTSGTSGVPKMVERSYAFLGHQFETLRQVKNSRSTEIELQTMPAFLFIGLATGSTSVIAAVNKLKPHKTDYAQVQAQVETNQVDTICASPAFLLQLAEQLKDTAAAKRILQITTGGAPVFPEDAAQLSAVFSNAQITVIYGSSEAEPISVIDGNHLALAKVEADYGLLAGIVHPETEIQIRNKWGRLRLMEGPPIGEIEVRGPNVNLSAGAAWHATGDSGYLRPDGQLVLTGPVSALLEHREQLWSPFLVDALARQIEG